MFEQKNVSRGDLLQRVKAAIQKRYRSLPHERTFALPQGIRGAYLVSTERGIILLEGKRGRLLTCWSGYGLAVADDGVYVVEELEPNKSRVLKLDKERLLQAKYFCPSSILTKRSVFTQPYRSTNGRIHQLIYTQDGNLLVAATEMNAIASVNGRTGEVRKIYPFRDRFSAPITGFDHNHINSVLFANDCIYFVAYKAGASSLIGEISREGAVQGWFANPTGYHDIYETDSGFLTCDTFGNDEHGSVISEAGPIHASFFESRACALRGISRTGDEWIFGHSHKGARAKRFDGKGGIVLVQDGGDPVYIELPASQVYQIARTDGQMLTDNPARLGRALRDAFGTAVPLGDAKIISE